MRNCAGCRAAVRELRSANAPLAALFPVGGLPLLAGDGPFPGTGHALARVWDALWGDLGHRVAGAAFRAQSVAQGIVPGRSAAVVASVAALAGGGFAIDQAVVTPRTAPSAPAVAQPARGAAPTVVDLVRPTGTPARTTTTSAPARPKPARRPRAKVRHRRARAAAVRTPRRTATRTPRASAATTTTRAAAASARTTAPAAAAPTPRATVPSAPPAPSRPAGEFGVETP
jgi:hypothetical protein